MSAKDLFSFLFSVTHKKYLSNIPIASLYLISLHLSTIMTNTTNDNNNISSSRQERRNSLQLMYKTWKSGNDVVHTDSLLGMTAASFFAPTSSSSSSAPTNPFSFQEDLLLAAPTDDIFDIDDMIIEPVPLQQQQQSRMDLLEDTLNQVLAIDLMDPFPMEDQSKEETTTGPPAVHLNDHKRSRPEEIQPEPTASLPLSKKARIHAATPPAPPVLEHRFRDYQSEQWSAKFQELQGYRSLYGHCCVPHTFKEAPSLARWVKRQRYQYKLLHEGKPSTLTRERIAALEHIGFVWDSHSAAWNERLRELDAFRQQHGHCNVPSSDSHRTQLATWVKCQRRQYKLFCEGNITSNMTLDRIAQLERIGFEWKLRRGGATGPR